MMIRAESSILELVETADGVAIAAPVREIADSSCLSHLRSVAAPSCRLHGLTCTRSQYGARQQWPVRLSPTRPQEVIEVKELLSELITMALRLHGCSAPHLGSRLVSARRMIANPVKSTTPLLLERAGSNPCQSLHSKIDPSMLAAGDTIS